MSESLVRETNQLKRALGPRSMFAKVEFLHDLAANLKQTTALRRQPIVECFIEDVMASSDTIQLSNTKAHINEHRDTQIFSLFDVSYFPTLSLDFLSYRPLHLIEDDFANRFRGNTNPVVIEHMSEGFHDRVVVALFPENHVDNMQGADDAIFYFIDKFIERHNRITRKLLDSIVDQSALRLVRSATQDEIAQASSDWVWLHEHFHHQGDMPLPDYLELKANKKPLAGLEELRVDVTGMLTCLGNCGLSERSAQQTYQFILSERLLRYAVEGIPVPNYDAVASQLLFNYLKEHSGISIERGMIHLAPDLPDVLARFLNEIRSIEALIHRQSPAQVEAQLLAFVNQYTNYDVETGEYQHIDFFYEVKQRLHL
jgi:Family of unknown function (DUF6421)